MRIFYQSLFFHCWIEYANLHSEFPQSVQVQENTDQKKFCMWVFLGMAYLCKTVFKDRKTDLCSPYFLGKDFRSRQKGETAQQKKIILNFFMECIFKLSLFFS